MEILNMVIKSVLQQQTNNKEIGFLKLKDIIGDKKANPPIQALLPLGRTTFLNKVKSGEYPAPVKLGLRSVAWRKSDIIDLISKIGGQK
jgi:prophage regulatory protein